MRLPIISVINFNKNRGFILIEIILVISISSLFIISLFALKISISKMYIWSINELDKLQQDVISTDKLINSDFYKGVNYGNNSKVIQFGEFNFIKSDFNNSWGNSNCFPRFNLDKSKIVLNTKGINIGDNNSSTDLEVRNSIIYLSADSSDQSKDDLYIIDNSNSDNPTIISSLNTGPGISSIAIAGPYLYLANTSSISQLQIVDIHNRSAPHLISSLKLPKVSTSTSALRASKVFYKNGFVYLGTNKWSGPELTIINVLDPYNPYIVGSFETNTLINDIYVFGDFAYLATSDEFQMRVLNIKDKTQPILVETYSPSGWEVQQGKVVNVFENNILLGRTVGGINRVNNHEIFIFSTSTELDLNYSHDIPSGDYGLLIRDPYIYILTQEFGHEFQIWDKDLSNKIYDLPIKIKSVGMKCDRATFYIITGNYNAFATIKT